MSPRVSHVRGGYVSFCFVVVLVLHPQAIICRWFTVRVSCVPCVCTGIIPLGTTGTPVLLLQKQITAALVYVPGTWYTRIEYESYVRAMSTLFTTTVVCTRDTVPGYPSGTCVRCKDAKHTIESPSYPVPVACTIPGIVHTSGRLYDSQIQIAQLPVYVLLVPSIPVSRVFRTLSTYWESCNTDGRSAASTGSMTVNGWNTEILLFNSAMIAVSAHTTAVVRLRGTIYHRHLVPGIYLVPGTWYIIPGSGMIAHEVPCCGCQRMISGTRIGTWYVVYNSSTRSLI